MRDFRIRLDISKLFFCIYSSWYFLPIFKGVFYGGTWNVIFFTFYLLSIACIFIKHIRRLWSKIEIRAILPIYIYILVFTMFYLIDWQDASSHIRVSFTYWGTFIFYFLSGENSNTRVRVGKFLLILYSITYCTTLFGVATDYTVVRALSYAATEESISKAYLLRNIANIYFIQTTVLLVPFAVYSFINSKSKKIIPIIFLVIELYFLFSASLTISIILYFVVLVISLLTLKQNTTAIAKAISIIGVITVIFLLIAFVNWNNVFIWLGTNIENKYISDRMFSMAALLSGTGNTGDAGLRLDLYLSSIKTFLAHPFGIGPNYSYVKFDTGIGHHSQLLDDMSRYGVFAILFYIFYFTGYKKLLIEKYRTIDMESIVIPFMIGYMLMIILNLAFRSPYESIFILYIIPVLPEIIRKKRLNKE